MKTRPIYENLDTSFANLSALLRYLRRRQFFGRVTIQIGDFEAEIILDDQNQLRVREFDKAAGRIAEGDDALQRVLIRAREPNGIINVYQTIAEEESDEILQDFQPLTIEEKSQTAAVSNGSNPTISTKTSGTQEFPSGALSSHILSKANDELAIAKTNGTPKHTVLQRDTGGLAGRAGFSLDFQNEANRRMNSQQFSENDWRELLALSQVVLQIFDKNLAQAQLDFSPAFRKSRTEIAQDYTFFNPANLIFDYQNGKISMAEQVNPQLFIAGLCEALSRISEKLTANPRFAPTQQNIIQNLSGFINHNKKVFDKFNATSHFSKLLR